MAEIRGKTEELLQGISYVIEWDGNTIGFVECTGLSETQDVAEYREGTDPSLYMRKVPGLIKPENIVLKRGITQNNACLIWRDEMKSIGPNAPLKFRRDVAIHIADHQLKTRRSFIAKNAWPVKWTLSDLNAESSDIIMEEMELTHEGLFPTKAGASTPLISGAVPA